ncbi:MAG TPA: hypothetical protein VHZ95_14650 [Polyangiales bacterium]|nr:hypothetical protein [Polyangiales bacterium]
MYRIAVAAAMTGAFSGWSILPMLALTCGGGVLLGFVLARAYVWVSRLIVDIPTAVLTQFLSTFAVWILADRLGLSAIITVVAYAMTLARHAPGFTNARRRIASYAVWDVAVFVLNVLAFVLIGLQLRGIISRLAKSDVSRSVLAALAVCVTVIVVRVLFWMPYNALVRWRMRREPAADGGKTPTIGSGAVIAWCGMRGIVTLAAALALPEGPAGHGFPQRDFIVLAAFGVVLSTLVLQGGTLGPLLRRLGLHDDGSVERELRIARAETARAALRSLDHAKPAATAALLRREYETRLRRSEHGSDNVEDELASLQRQSALVQRDALMSLRARSIIGDDAFHAAEEEIDLLELSAEGRVHPEPDA